MRRSGRAYFSVDAGLDALEPASQEMAKLLGWSEAKRSAECEACLSRHDANNALFPQAQSSARRADRARPASEKSS
jgi:hypothetical protein